MTKLNWTASESEKVEPFRTSPSAFDSTRLQFSDEDGFNDRELTVIESEEDWRAAQPEILIALDVGKASRDSGIPEDELSVALVMRDRILNRFKLIDRWGTDSLPVDSISLKSALVSFSHSRLLDIGTYLFPSSTKDRGEGIASNMGQVLARKVFKVRVYEQKTKFPKRWRTPEEFEERGLPRDTVFWVEWLGHDLNVHPRDTFEVWLNIQYKQQITSLELGGKAGDVLKMNLAASILTELASAIFSADDQELNEPSGTIAIIAEELSEVSGKSFEDMRHMFNNGHDGHSLVRAWAHQKLGVNDALGRLDFLGKKK